jgi:peptidoglycan/LPS O-acetylase OafA/YrhL
MLEVPAGGGVPRAVADHHHNNFDFLRWLAASMVLFSHEYAVLGRGGEEPLVRLTGGFAALGTLGVDVFFVISGCLVTASMARGTSIPYFIGSRALRIVPGLVVALLVTVLVFGALATSLPLPDYFRDPSTWRYVSRGLALHDLQWTLPGVFEGSPLPAVVNGSLWSLWPEVQMYGAVTLLGIAAWIVPVRRRVVLAVGMVAVAIVALASHPDLAGQHLEGASLARLAVLFALGAIVGLMGWRARAGWPCFAAALACALLARHSALFVPAFDLAVALGVIGLAYARLPRVRNWGRYGDWSYGMYVYAFPVQQLVTFYFPGIPFVMHLVLAYAVTLTLGAVSWHWIESPALRLKGQLRSRLAVPLLDRAHPRG